MRIKTHITQNYINIKIILIELIIMRCINRLTRCFNEMVWHAMFSSVIKFFFLTFLRFRKYSYIENY